MAEPFIKLYKKMLDWEWYDDVNTFRLFLHCLLRANWKSGSWHGIHYEPGQFITSLPTLASETKLSVRQVRVALDHLKMTGELTDFRQANCRVITVVKWNEYQSIDRPDDIPVTDQCQTSDRPVTADKEIKNIKNKRNKDIYISAFEEFWSVYPRKTDKGRAYQCYQARLRAGCSEEELMTACKNYADVCKKNGTEQRYIKQGSTFLGINEPFRDYLKGEVNEPVGRILRVNEEERNRELDEHIRRAEAGEFDAEDEEFRRMWDDVS